MTRITNPQIREIFNSYPPPCRKKLFQLRELILSVADENSDSIGEILETLKWGQPSYLPVKKNIGTTIRIHWQKSRPDQYGIYFHCQTKMIYRIKKKFGKKFDYDGKRAIIFKLNQQLPIQSLKECIEMALTYHLKKKM